MLKKVKVGPITYQIKPIVDEEQKKKLHGSISPAWRQTIWINPDLKGEDAVDTMFHEILHSVDELMRLKLHHDKIYYIAEALAKVLKENKDLRIWIDEQLT